LSLLDRNNNLDLKHGWNTGILIYPSAQDWLKHFGGVYNMAKGIIGTVAKWLVFIGGLNWGLTGVGGFAKMNLNVVNLILGSMPMVENIVYVLVGLAAVYVLLGMFKK